MNQGKPFLTVFTSTYNRTKTLPRTYESLRRQTDKDFEWLIVDDGSTDNTEEIVKPWLEAENGFPIRYIKKKNEGFHTGYNTAIANMDSTLAVCIDSDDYMPDDAVEKIHQCWMERGGPQYGGISGLDCHTNGELIGGRFPDGLNAVNLISFSQGKYNVKQGDKKIVVRTDLYKQVAPMKVYPGEKFFNPHYMALEISRKYDFLALNECLCLVDYQPNGMGSNMFRQYKNSPNSFLEIRKQHFSFSGNSFKSQIRNGIHFVSSALLAHRFTKEFWQFDKKLLLMVCFLPGAVLAVVTTLKG
ncbi:MAG: glycosyltransferase family 2 protein [Clostridia bacterium]|nr:glycosyltransferase family 2 protein [Clostridia bacterium]